MMEVTGRSCQHATSRQRELMTHYAQALDGCDWALLASLFAEDAVFVAREVRRGRTQTKEICRFAGRDAIVGTISVMIESCSATHHMVGNEAIDISEDGTSAKASFYFRAYHAGAGDRSHLFEESLGRFDLDTIRVGSEWKIVNMEENIMIMLGTADAFGVGPDLNAPSATPLA